MKKLSFSLLMIVIICLAAATIIEKYHGSHFVYQHLYSSVWFSLLWGVFALSSVIYVLQRKLQQNISAFLMHFSFLIILAGALLTSLTARHGTLHLRMGEKSNTFTTADKEGYQQTIMMPISLSLDTFIISYYPGTNAPADYTSRFSVTDPTGKTIKGEVSMNHIFSYQGIRFYQSSFDSDKCGSYLSVNEDRWGIPVTYTGYFLLFTTMLWNLLAKKGKFRRLLHHPLLKKSVLAIVLTASCITMQAADITLSKKEARKFGEVMVLYNNRIAPLQTLALDFTTKLTGKNSYKDFTAEQVLAGWIFFPEQWGKEPMLEVKNSRLRELLHIGKQTAVTDFFTEKGEYRLEPYWKELHQGKPDALQKAVSELDEKIQLVMMAQRKELLKVFPMTTDGKTYWYTPTSELPETINENEKLFIAHTFDLLQESILRKNSQQTDFILEKLTVYQQKNTGKGALTELQIKAEYFYNIIPFSILLYRLNLTIGLIALFLTCRNMLRTQPATTITFRKVTRILTGLFICSFIILSACLGLRTYISGRLPMSNGYEAMMLIAWCIQLTTLWVYRKFRPILAFGFLLSGFFLLVASIGQMNPQITPLMPVLSSPLLSLHVSLIMMSYALFSFTFLNGLLSLILLMVKGKRDEQIKKQVNTLHVMSQLFLIPGLFLLGVGIFVGAIWANVSWGRYWGWDPKEVWALITFLFYSIALHDNSISFFRRPVWFHTYMCIAFLTVLMTYFGVNYVLGGMHSYAG